MPHLAGLSHLASSLHISFSAISPPPPYIERCVTTFSISIRHGWSPDTQPVDRRILEPGQVPTCDKES